MKLGAQLLESIVSRLNKLEDVVDEVRWFIECNDLISAEGGSFTAEQYGSRINELFVNKNASIDKIKALLAELDE